MRGDVGGAYLDVRADFRADTHGFAAGVGGHIVTAIGGELLGERYDALKIDAEFSAGLDGGPKGKVVAVFADGYEQTLFEPSGSSPIEFSENIVLYSPDLDLHTGLSVWGFPVDVTLTLSPSLSVEYGAGIRDGELVTWVAPRVRLDVTLVASVDLWLVEGGGGGHVTLIDARPSLMGAAYMVEENGQVEVRALVNGRVQVEFLTGRLFAFIEVGLRPFFSTRIEHEIANFDGWDYDYPVFQQQIAD